MKEQEYIDVSELQKLSVISNLLRTITPANSNVIDSETCADMIDTIDDWIETLYTKIKVSK